MYILILLIGLAGLGASLSLAYRDWVENVCHGFCSFRQEIIEESEILAIPIFISLILYGLFPWF